MKPRLKKFLKITVSFFGVGVLLIGLFLFHTWYFKPLSINLLFARTFIQVGLDSPELMSRLGVLEPLGIKGHNDELDDESIAANQRFMNQMKDAYQVLLSFDDKDLSEKDLMSKRVAQSWLKVQVEGEGFRFHNYPVNQMFGPHSGFPSFMESTHKVNSIKDAENYVTRLSKIGIKFDQVLEGLNYREQNEILPPQFVVTKVLEQMKVFIAKPAEESVLITALLDKMESAGLDTEDQKQIADSARLAIEDTVYPAYEKLISYFEALDEKVDENRGYWSLPDGDQAYALAVKRFTTTDYSADYLHDFGLSEVERIQAEILGILEGEGWDISNGFSPAIGELAEREEFYYSDSDEGRESILADYRVIIEDISTGLDSYFGLKPQAAVEVQRMAEFQEKDSPVAKYQPPSIDGSRPGVFYVNLFDLKATPKYQMRNLAYHEAVPGHHFQLAIQQELKGLPFFRRIIPFVAYSEGWGLYAERVAWELGYQEDPYDNIGRLQGELFRAVRLVVDTGIHARRWTREQAIEYMALNTGVPQSDVVAEVERYFVLPGQALAYKVGMTKILELRARAQSELGDRFDMRAFHNVILGNGAVPLLILEDLVDDYIEATRA